MLCTRISRSISLQAFPSFAPSRFRFASQIDAPHSHGTTGGNELASEGRKGRDSLLLLCLAPVCRPAHFLPTATIFTIETSPIHIHLRKMARRRRNTTNAGVVQGSAKGRALGCVNSPLRPEGARRRDSRNLGTAF